MSERKAIHLKRLQNRYKEAIERVEQTEGERLRKYKQKIVLASTKEEKEKE